MVTTDKRRRRLTVLLAVAVVLTAGAATAYVLRRNSLDERAKRDRDDGKAALARGDYEAALDGLGRFLQRLGPTDATCEDYVLYARARSRMPLPNGKHLVQVIGSLRKAVTADPRSTEAKSDLLDAYLAVGYRTEALALLETMLADDPRDLRLLRTRRDVLVAQRRFADALPAAKAVNDAAPDDLEAWLTTLQVLIATGELAEKVDEWVEETVAAHAGDARFELLRAVAAARRGDDEAARARVDEILDRLLSATGRTSEAAFVKLLVPQLDVAGRFDDSLAALARAQGQGDAELSLELARRLWYARRAAEIPALAATLEPGAAGAEEMQALRAVSLFIAGRAAEAEPLRRALADSAAAESRAWSAFVEAAAPGARADAATAKALMEAASTVPRSAILRQALGDVHAALGETDLALRDWDAAAKAAPAWSAPLLAMAKLRLATPGRQQLAEAPARAALRRAPHGLDEVRTAIEAMRYAGSGLDAARARELLAVIDEVRQAAPAAAGALVPLRAELLAATDRTAAERALRETLALASGPDQPTLLRLARVAADAGIPLEDEFLARCEQLHGVTPQLALARASARARAGDAAGGLAAFDEMRSRAGTAAAEPEWGLARAGYLDTTDDPAAGAAWISLADARPGELAPQLGAMRSRAAWSDRAGIARVVERLKTLAGEDGVTWRVARARLALTDPDAGDARIAEAAAGLGTAVAMAPESVAAHLLLARCHERLRNLKGAEEELWIAASLSPDSAWIALQQARVAQRLGRSADVRGFLERTRVPGGLAPDQAEEAAYLLALHGDARAAAEMLAPLVSREAAGESSVLLLAQVHARLGDTRRAIELCESRVKRFDPEVAEFLAGLYASSGRTADADAAIARLDSSNSRPGDRELVRARVAARWSTPAAARAAYRAAIDAAPARADVWGEALGRAVAAGDAAETAAIVDDPRASGIEPVAFARGLRKPYVEGANDPLLRDALAAMLTAPAARPVLTRAIESAAARNAGAEQRLAAARDVGAAAEKNADVLALQLLAVRLAADVGRTRRAAQLAAHAMTQFPASVAAARLAAETFARREQWNDALDAALAWRDRAGRPDLECETFVAGALLRADRIADAEASLAPHADAALASPAANARFLVLHVLTLVRVGRTNEAQRVLADLVARSAEWRRIPLTLGPEWLGDAAGANAWLAACAPGVREADPGDRLLLARAWAAAWERYRDPAMLAAAKSEFDRLVAAPGCSADALFAAAMLAEQAGERDAAIRTYGAALVRDPGHAGARNNLAMLLAGTGRWQEAVTEATRAAEAAPGNATCLDTLAHALRAGREYARAKAALERAIALEPGNAGWRLNLAELLRESGDDAGMRLAVASVAALETDGADLSDADRVRLETLRATIR